MAKRGMLGEMASKTVEAGRTHVAKVLSGEETLPEAAGAAVEDLLSGSKGKSSSKAKAPKSATAVRKKSTKPKATAKKKPVPKNKGSRKKSRSK
jgi:hypothetical protein